LDFDQALQAHADWKLRLLSEVRKNNACALDPDLVSLDDRCALGKWIHDEMSAIAPPPNFNNLRARHAEFHQAAGKLIALIRQGQKEDAARELDNRQSEFNRLSIEVTGLLLKMKADALKKSKI
jgi:hypothetical protein